MPFIQFTKNLSSPTMVCVAIARRDTRIGRSCYANYWANQPYHFQPVNSPRFAAKIRDRKGKYFYFTGKELDEIFEIKKIEVGKAA